jgi:alpha-glucosidase
MADHRWWQAGVIYQIYPRSFADANGDGVGDLAGVTQHMDHLRDLGVDAVWLSPFYVSPMVDFGYDISDHTAVDPLFGDLADFDRLVAAAHERDIRVLVDFVPNHTSEQHPWFLDARSGRTSPRRDWYLWADPAPDGGPPNNWRSVFGGPAWTLDPTSGQYYYHAYLTQQPDLNWRNPGVRAAQHDAMRFWLDRGVDGFRLDACRQLVKDDLLRDNPPNPDHTPDQPPYDALLPIYTTDRPETLDVLVGLRKVLDERRPDGDGVLLAEMYLPVARLPHYYGAHGEGIHLPSNMHLIRQDYRAEEIGALVAEYEAALPAHAWPNWVLGNHDRRRVASRVGAARARVLAMLLLTLRGTPILYYGDEIGMTDVPVPDHLAQDPFARQVPGIGVGRDPERSPMQWSPAAHGGFCPPGATPWLPLAADADRVNVAVQGTETDSVLALHRSLLALRRREPALSVGDHEPVTARDGVLAYRRVHEGRALLVVLNLGEQGRSVPVPPTDLGGSILIDTKLARTGEAVGGTLALGACEGVLVGSDAVVG